MKKRWVLASVYNVCASGGKSSTVFNSVISFMGIFWVVTTGKYNPFLPRLEDAASEAIYHWWNLAGFTPVKLYCPPMVLALI